LGPSWVRFGAALGWWGQRNDLEGSHSRANASSLGQTCVRRPPAATLPPPRWQRRPRRGERARFVHPRKQRGRAAARCTCTPLCTFFFVFSEVEGDHHAVSARGRALWNCCSCGVSGACFQRDTPTLSLRRRVPRGGRPAAWNRNEHEMVTTRPHRRCCGARARRQKDLG
jgi:hypothetical protein